MNTKSRTSRSLHNSQEAIVQGSLPPASLNKIKYKNNIVKDIENRLKKNQKGFCSTASYFEVESA